MIRDITIGQYYPAESVIHRLDPRVKIVCTLLFLVSLFIQNSVLGYGLATIFLVCVIRISRVPFKFIVKGLKPVVILLLFTVVMNLFLTRGGETLVHFWIQGRRNSGSFLDIHDNGERTPYVCPYGGKTDLSCHRFFSDDIYHVSQRTYGWT